MVTYFRPNQACSRLTWQQRQKIAVTCMVVFGICCWSVFLAKNVDQTVSAATHDQMEFDSINSNGFLFEARDEFAEFDDEDNLIPGPPAADVDVPGLELQAIVISASHRTALICGQPIGEGQNGSFYGIKFRVDRISKKHVAISFLGRGVSLSIAR